MNLNNIRLLSYNSFTGTSAKKADGMDVVKLLK